MRNSIALILVAITATNAPAQVTYGGSPYGWGHPGLHQAALPTVELPVLERQKLIAENDTSDEGRYRFGVQRFLDVDVLAQGQWDTLPDQRRMCRFVLHSPGAVMISLQFDVYDLTPNVWMFLYNEQRTVFLGGFNEENELRTGGLATAVVPGDAVVIEVIEPLNVAVPSHLHLASITHGYKDIFHFGEQGMLKDYDPGYQSATCQNNVICPVAADWQQQKHAVAMFLRPDGNGCTGQLVNNTQQNGIPYFLFANHCYVATESQWVFYFNYESPTCTGSTGPTTQTISGATYKASDPNDDFALVQLSSIPPASYQPYYAGWDHSGNTPTSGTVIEHPLYDVKKIAFDYNPLTSYTTANTQFWRTYWDSGLIESTASGSGLYDQNKRLVGILTQGPQTCANVASTPSGSVKLSMSWDGSAATSRLRDWLDPANTSMTLNGYDPNGNPTVIKVKVKVFLEGPFVAGTGLMIGSLRSSGLIPLTEPYTGIGYIHVGGGGGESTTSAVLSGSGNTSVVDWVVVELRNKNNNTQVLATRSSLLLRNGSVVDVDGTSDVSFVMPADNYFIAVRHRNHLGAMTQLAQALSATASLKDLTNGSIALYGGSAATKLISGTACLYAGDADRNGVLKFSGSSNDRDRILTRIGGSVPSTIVSGYFPEDLNLDGAVKFQGAANDRDIILANIGGNVPTNILVQQLP